MSFSNSLLTLNVNEGILDNISRILGEKHFMTTAIDLIKNKTQSEIITVKKDAKVFEAIKLMSDYNVGAVLVVNNSGDVAGILSERDVIRKVDSLKLSADIIDVEKIMSAKVLFVNGFQPIEECMEIMISKGIRHLPVYQEEKLVGMISIRDVLKQLILEQKTMIAHLENYINGI